MKKLIALLLCLMLALPVFAMADDTVEITLWTYPIGSWGNAETVDGIIANFNAVHPEIKVTVQYLDYQSGDDQVTTAIEAKTTPDIIMGVVIRKNVLVLPVPRLTAASSMLRGILRRIAAEERMV